MIQQPENWWLVELDVHGNPTLVDGSHSTRAGVEKAYFLYQSLGFTKGKRHACAHVLISEVVPNSDGVNREALGIVKATMDWAEGAAFDAGEALNGKG